MVGFGHVPDGGFISSSGIGFGSDDLTGLAGADLSIFYLIKTHMDAPTCLTEPTLSL